MGSQSVNALDSAGDIDVVARVEAGDALDTVVDQRADVVLDFTQPEAAVDNVHWCVEHGINIVVGTSGFSESRLDHVRGWLGTTPRSGVLIVPNFSIGAALMMQLAARAAAWFESAEVIEMHHPQKVDAPSGTATRTAELIAQARDDAGRGRPPDSTTSDPDGARGADVAGVNVHAVRQNGFTASHLVQFGSPGETFSIRHDSVDRSSFMPGVVAAVRALGAEGAPRGLSVGLPSVLDL